MIVQCVNLVSRLALDNDGDFEDFYNIKSDSQNVIWSGFSAPPEKASFRNWYSHQINDNLCRDIYLVENKPERDMVVGGGQLLFSI